MLTTTLSQKGQLVLPKDIRQKLDLKKSDKFDVQIKDEKIILTPISDSDSVFGMFKTNSPISKEDIKNSYKKAVTQKASNKNK